jgi:putative monooxygenase
MSKVVKVSMADAPVSTRLGGTIRAMLTPNSVGAGAGFLGTMTLRPDEYVAAHYHPYSDEFLFVTNGAVVVTVDDEEHHLSRTDAIMVPRHRAHRIENRADEDALVVFQIAPLAPSPEEGHVEVEPPPHPDAAPPSVGG